MQSKKLIYAGIGSRSTPGNVLAVMQQVGKNLALAGWRLRSGNCSGADQAFQHGANAVDARLVELCLPWKGYEAQAVAPDNALCLPSSAAYALAERYHPSWRQCSAGARAMHARNAHIILGPRLNKPVSYVVCWTPGGRAQGGTALGIRLAQAYGIPVYNIALASGRKFVEKILGVSRCALASSQADFGW